MSDIVVVATGNIGLIKGKWIKEGAVVIDVGINQMADKSKKSGFRLVGDVCFDEACERAGYITPVPAGVGPMTVACLLLNTMDAYHHSLESSVDPYECPDCGIRGCEVDHEVGLGLFEKIENNYD